MIAFQVPVLTFSFFLASSRFCTSEVLRIKPKTHEYLPDRRLSGPEKRGYLEIPDLTELTGLEFLRDKSKVQIQFFESELPITFYKTLFESNGLWYGESHDEMESTLNLMLSNSTGTISGSANVGTKVYNIITLPTHGGIRVSQVDLIDLPSEKEYNHDDRHRYMREKLDVTQREMRAAVAADNGNFIDILCMYTPEALCSEVGKRFPCNINHKEYQDVMDNKCRLSISETNVAFELSGVLTRLNLVHTAIMETNFIEPTDMCNMVDLLRESDETPYSQVRSIRNEFGADLVNVLISNQQYCGCGNIFDGLDNSAFGVTNRQCATGYYSFGHEIGHNLGCNHNRNEDNSWGFGFAYGYQERSSRFRTIMSLDCEGIPCPRIPRFSTPNISFGYDGFAIGTPLHDNVKQINAARFIVANFRKSIINITEDVESSPVQAPSYSPTFSPTTPTTNVPTIQPVNDTDPVCTTNEVLLAIYVSTDENTTDADVSLSTYQNSKIPLKLIRSTVHKACALSGKCYRLSVYGINIRSVKLKAENVLIIDETDNLTNHLNQRHEYYFKIDSINREFSIGGNKKETCTQIGSSAKSKRKKCKKSLISRGCPNTCSTVGLETC